jgi:hypothetical protein
LTARGTIPQIRAEAIAHRGTTMRMRHPTMILAATLIALSTTAAQADIQVVNQSTREIKVTFYAGPAAGLPNTQCATSTLPAGQSVTVNHAAQCPHRLVSLGVTATGAASGTGCERLGMSWDNGRLVVTGSATLSSPMRCAP